ncbi:MAG: SsrA-binding protein SmpB [Verrucomicrobiae bacterium]|nr:SsrA-binding protein SmpB [Verrucomicrobiae bacterium]
METREIVNRKARHDFEIFETLEAGIALRGTEVKSIRQGKAVINDAFARVDKEEVWLVGAHIDEYAPGNRFNHDPKRFRKLLLHRAEIRRLFQRGAVKGLTLVPLKLYFNQRGVAKVLLGVARGKGGADRRNDLKKRDTQREIQQAMRRRR